MPAEEREEVLKGAERVLRRREAEIEGTGPVERSLMTDGVIFC